MASTDTLYSALFALPELLERGRDNTIKCPVYRAGALVAPSSGTVNVYDANNTLVVSAGAVTVSGSVAQYTVTAGVLASPAMGDGWRVEWSLAMPDSTTRLFRNAGSLVRAAMAPPISDVDLFRRVSGLDPSSNVPLSNHTDYQTFIDEAHTEIQLRLISAGRRPWLVMEPSAMRQPYLLLTLALIFEDFRSRLNAAYAETAADYRRQYEAAWTGLTFHYDESTDGQSAQGRRKSSRPTTWLCSRG